jgi:hypothetical protein
MYTVFLEQLANTTHHQVNIKKCTNQKNINIGKVFFDNEIEYLKNQVIRAKDSYISQSNDLIKIILI